MATSVTVSTELALFIQKYKTENNLLTEVFDPEWRSPCEKGQPFVDQEGVTRIRWSPKKRSAENQENGLTRFEKAIETNIHPDIKEYYGSYWSAGLEANAIQGPVSLILLWNEDDIDRLIENLIGHTIERQRLGAPLTTFFACTDKKSELILSVENKSGNVMLEKPGDKKTETIASSLEAFLSTLKPANASRHPEQMAKTIENSRSCLT